MKRKIFITGGHFSPAMAVIKALQEEGNWEIFYIGRQYAMEDDTAEALEYQEIKKIPGVTYLVINAGRLQRKFFVKIFQSLKALAKVPVGFVQAVYWIARYQPNVVLSFGGYVALPVVMVAWLFAVPVVTHEQTVVSGLANKIIARLANKVLLSWPNSLSHFPAGKAVLTGNPLRQEIVALTKKPQTTNSKLTTIYITGGNQGAHAINTAVAPALPTLLKKYTVIHQTGASEIYHDYEKLTTLKDKLPQRLQQKYSLHKFLDSEEVANALSQADLVISRAGANIVTELAVLGKVALLIPLPWSGKNEQLKNAQFLRENGAAVVLAQAELTPARLLATLSEIKNNWSAYQLRAKNARGLVPLDAAGKIVAEIKNV